MTLTALLCFPDENLTKSRHFGDCCVLTSGLTNGRREEGVGRWERGWFFPWEYFRPKAKGYKVISECVASLDLTGRLLFIMSSFVFHLICNVNYQRIGPFYYKG